ncbi:MAG: dTDP-4-dehydrorhamnose 3,5-epimerase [Acidobacteria bacterium]|nr:dTDP-4-dehydrorhamnose 3,5-epimerase [Acidobacteriota bacterium]
MHFVPAPLEGAFIIDIEPAADHRGSFARTYCAREFELHGLTATFVQCNVSMNLKRGTLRGLHYQAPPETEGKLVRCTRGSVFDVIVDLRPESQTYKRYFALELSAATGKSLFIPEGFAHGFQTLEDDVELFYQMTNFYAPDSAAGLRFDDPELGIAWPLPVTRISEKDLLWPLMTGWENPFKNVPATRSGKRVDS